MRLTLRGKIVLIFISVILVFGAVMLSVHTGFAVKKTSKPDYIFYTVKPDDTLWEIASKHTKGKKDVRETLYEIKKVNDVQDSELNVGMRLAIFQ